MTDLWHRSLGLLCALLLPTAAAVAQGTCDLEDCATIEISEEPDGILVTVVSATAWFGSVRGTAAILLQFDDSLIRNSTLTPGTTLSHTTRRGQPLLAFTMAGSGGVLMREVAKADFTATGLPLAERDFETPRVAFGGNLDSGNSLHHFAITPTAVFYDDLGNPTRVLQDQWALFEGGFHTLGIRPGAEAVFRDEGNLLSWELRIRTVATASLTVVVDALPADGTDFSFSAGLAGEPDPTQLTLDDAATDDGDGVSDSATLSEIVAGTYEITQLLPAGWAIDSASCTGGADAGALSGSTLTVEVEPREDVTCFLSTSSGAASIALDLVPDDGQDVLLTGDLGDFALDDDGDPVLPSVALFEPAATGEQAVTAAIPAGWDLTAIACSDDSAVDLATATAVLGIDPEETVDCTFTLTRRAAIDVVLDMVPDGPQAVDFGGDLGAFMLVDDGVSPGLAARAFDNLQPGDYSVSATVPEGYDLTNRACDDTATGIPAGDAGLDVQLAPGASPRCTWTMALGQADLTIALEDRPNPLDPTQIELTIGVSNLGPATATGVTIQGTLGAGVQIEGSSCTLDVSGAAGGGSTLAWAPGNLVADAQASCVLDLRVTPSVASSVQVEVTGAQTDTDPSSNHASFGLAVVAVAVPAFRTAGLLIFFLLLGSAGWLALRPSN